MSVSLITAPANFKPAYNPIQWVFSSTNVAQCDFSFIMDLYVNNVFAVRLKAFPEGSNDYGYFNIQRVLQDYLSFNFRHNLNGWIGNDLGICDYYVEIRESFNSSSDCTGSVTLSSVEYTSLTSPPTNKLAWNGALQYKAYPQFTLGKYVCTNSDSKFLTNIPFQSLIPIDASFTIGFLQTDSTVYEMEIQTFSYSNVLINTYLYPNSQYVPADTSELKISVGVGPVNLNAAGLSLASPPVDIIDGDVKFYTIQLKNNSLQYVSEKKRFDIDTRCTNFQNYRIWWFNRLGEFDSYSFALRNKKNLDIKRNEYERLLAVDYTEGDRGQSIINIDANYNLEFNSNWLTEAEGKWMEELFTSPEVYVVDNTPIVKEYAITGIVYDGGFAAFVLTPGVEMIPLGSSFEYGIPNGATWGIPDRGEGEIVSYSGNDRFLSDVVASINVSGSTIGTLTVTIPNTDVIPVVISSTLWEEKQKVTTKNIQYTIQCKPSFKPNIQSL